MKNFFFFGENKSERMIFMKKVYKALLIAIVFLSLFAVKFIISADGNVSSACTFI